MLDWWERNERYVGLLALTGGFIFDWFTLRRIDLLTENLVMLIYIGVAMLSIVLISLVKEHLNGQGFLDELFSFALQFSFGGLASAFFIFYSRSASFLASWPFLLLLIALLVGNEFFRHGYAHLAFRGTVLFICLFSYAIFSLPILVGRMGTGVFVASGLLSLLVIWLFSRLLKLITPSEHASGRLGLFLGVLAFYFGITALYFTNYLPPIPLALKDYAVAHSVAKQGSEYAIVREERTWAERLTGRGTLHLRAGEPAFIYSAIFAPTKISAGVAHHWQYFDVGRDRWISLGHVPYTLIGGADGGYKGYTLKPTVYPGAWRVDIETERGQVIGRINFDIEIVTDEPSLVSITR